MKNYVLLTIHSLWGKALTLVVKNNIHRTQILSSSLTSVHALNKKKIFIINVNINLISCSMYLMFYSHLSKAFCNFGWFLLSHLLNISNVKMIMLLSVNHRQGSKCEKLKEAGFICQMWLKKKTSVLLLSSSSEVNVHI